MVLLVFNWCRLGELLITLNSSHLQDGRHMNDDQTLLSDSLMTDNSVQRLTFTDELDEEESKRGVAGDFSKMFFEKPCEVTDALNLARTLFDLREFRKCCHVLKPYANERNQSALFLHYYSLFLVSEQSKEEEIIQSGDKVQCSTVQNKEVVVIESELRTLYEEKKLNGINLYLYGVILRERNKKDEAKEAL